MNRKLTTIIIMLSALLSVGVLQAKSLQAERALVEGKDYTVMAAKGSKKQQVMEFFSYACGHCYTMEGFIGEFKKNHPDIQIIPVPTDLGHPQWQIYVKAYYLGELLKVIDKSHSKIFHMINVERKHMTKDSDLKDFFMGLGVDGAKFDSANKSFALNSKIRKAKQLARKYQISGTPTFVANQRYRLNNRELATNNMIEKALVELSIVR